MDWFTKAITLVNPLAGGLTTVATGGFNLLTKESKPPESPPKNASPEQMEAWREWQRANTKAARARRLIALIVTWVWAITIVFTFFGTTFGFKPNEYTKAVMEDIHGPFMMVMAYYFFRDKADGLLNMLGGKVGGGKGKSALSQVKDVEDEDDVNTKDYSKHPDMRK